MIANKQVAFGKTTVSNKLPIGVFPIEYLESTGTQYIDTGLIPDTQDVRVEITYANGTGHLFGSRNSSAFVASNNLWSLYAESPSVCRTDWIGINTSISVTQSAKTIVFSSDAIGSSITYNDTTKTGSIKTPVNLPLILFGVNTNGTITVATRMTLYSFKMWKNGILIFDGIPVRKGDVGYMYDQVSGQLFGNSGTGEFVLGPDIVDSTAQDYIQDGLVAMWDGIENAGYGKHTNNIADGWMNLVDGTIMSIPSVNDMYFGDSFLHRGLKGVLNTGIGVAEKNTTTEMVVEVLSENNPSTNGRFFGSNVSSARFEIDILTNQPKEGPRVYYLSPNSSNHINRRLSCGRTDWSRLWSVGYSIDNDGVLSFYDEVSEMFYTLGNVVVDTSLYDGIILLLGCWSLNGIDVQSPLICNIHSVRRYNRVLTEEERSYLHEIDKQRFGL